MTAGASDIETALSAASADSAVVRAAYGSELVQHAKGGHDFATNADLDAERAILDVIAAARCGDVRIGEETGTEGGSSSRRWLVDPLCGTRNFAAQTPLVAVNVALVDASSVAAVCADPIAGELFWTDGQRSFRRTDGADVPLSPSAESGLVDVNCDGPADNPFLGPSTGQPLSAEHRRAGSANRARAMSAGRGTDRWPRGRGGRRRTKGGLSNRRGARP